MLDQIQQHFDFKITEIKPLVGYDNLNYRLTANDTTYIFKSYRFSEERKALIEAEIDLLLFLQRDGANAKYPKPVPFRDGSYTKVLDIDGEERICRILTFLDGQFMGDAEATPKLFHSLGRFLAQMDIQLLHFESYVYKARKWEWDIQYLGLNRKYLDAIPDAKDRNLVRYFMDQFDANVVPVWPDLPKSVIYNDANEWNILTKNDEVSAAIDFGDVAYSARINELAVAIVYACYDKENPLEWASYIIKAYHEVFPLQENELSLLYYLISARLCISVCNSAFAKKNNPENTYAGVSEKMAWAMLYCWIEISPTKAQNVFLAAAGYPIQKEQPIIQMIDRRHLHISPILSLSYSKPIQMERSAFQYMYDTDGNTFLDAYNNIPHVGHSHPHVIETGRRQMSVLNTNTRYLYDLLPEYAERLLSKFPKKLNKIYFVNSGSAATDLALRLAFAHTRHRKIMVMEHGYHGNTQMAMAVSDYKFSNAKGAGQADYILKTPIPDTFRGSYRKDYGTVGKQYAADAIETINQSEEPIAAFIAEPIVGCGGQVPLAKGYLKEIYPAIRAQGGVCISDEVQTGFGRLGDYFWGFEAQEVVPDIVILGKPMGNGHPMGAVVTTSDIADSFGKGVEFFSSFGGNPVSCAIGIAVLDVIEEEHLQKNAKEVGDYYKSLLHGLQQKYPCIGDVRGSGLFLGVELVKPESLEPDTALAQRIKNELRDRHILISTDGPYDNVLKTKPPLCFTKDNAERVVMEIERVLEKH